jgi:hypothetical protein
LQQADHFPIHPVKGFLFMLPCVLGGPSAVIGGAICGHGDGGIPFRALTVQGRMDGMNDPNGIERQKQSRK